MLRLSTRPRLRSGHLRPLWLVAGLPRWLRNEAVDVLWLATRTRLRSEISTLRAEQESQRAHHEADREAFLRHLQGVRGQWGRKVFLNS